jgi:hypothetical protein
VAGIRLTIKTNQTVHVAFKNQFNLFFHVPKMGKWNRYDALNIKI